MRSFFSLVPGQESKVSVFQNVEFFLYCYFPILLVLYSKLAGKTVYQSSASIEHASQLCKQKNKKKNGTFQSFFRQSFISVFFMSRDCLSDVMICLCTGFAEDFVMGSGGVNREGCPHTWRHAKSSRTQAGKIFLFFSFCSFSFLF